MLAYRRSRPIDSRIPNLGTKWSWVVNFTTRPLYSGQEPRYPSNRRLGRPQTSSGRFWRREKLPACTGIQVPECPACSAVATPTTLHWLALGSKYSTLTLVVSLHPSKLVNWVWGNTKRLLPLTGGLAYMISWYIQAESRIDLLWNDLWYFRYL
jgi:hypothetical protein